MSMQHILLHTLSVLDRSPTSAATVRKPYVISQDKNEAPCADLRTAEIGDLRTNYAYERLIGQLLDMLDDDKIDEARDLVRAEWREIHGLGEM